MKREDFEKIAEEVFNSLPSIFTDKIDNIHIVVEDYPNEENIKQLHVDKNSLLGLYQGVPLKYRGSWYGTSPTVPDKITLFQRNIESASRDEKEITEKIREVMLHEIGHYFGMTEKEIRYAMKYF